MNLINKEIGFIHIPKTGGKSMIEFFKKNNLSYKYSLHQPLDKLWNIGYKDCFNITIVRHPYSRVLSFYNFFEFVRNETLDFDDYINNIDKVSNLIRPCYEFCIVDDKFKIDMVLRLEKLNQDLEMIKDKFNLSIDNFPYINKNNQQFIDRLNLKHKNKIYKIFKKDFKKFSYEP